ncbi:hypothetical protein DV515_00015673 [Chloebia gouldiae]|uniref:Carbonic anhydrase 6 n=1 Tax=Chloebia gouldiae TaxID=44316 RepID=A0A3L8RUV2_CHLGU|nr:hypothetical protein DV515_00015673 [Chloebia gouldiae]
MTLSLSWQLHIVHYNSANYSSFEEAKDKPQGLAVLAFLYTVGVTRLEQGAWPELKPPSDTSSLGQDGHFENTYYSEFISKLARIRFAGQSTTLSSLDIQAMLPENLSHFYRYQGSLTTPPVLRERDLDHLPLPHCPVTHSGILGTEELLGHLSYRAFGVQLLENTLLDWHNRTLRNDYRHAQPLRGRVVEASFPAQQGQGRARGPGGGQTPVGKV